jgi:AmmeMemoRadiSam system protein B
MTGTLPEGAGEIDPQAPLPALRPLEAYPVTHEGERRIVLRDTLDVAGGVLMVPVPVYYLTAQLDGHSSIRDLQADFASRFGHLIPAEQVADLVRQLDEALFLDTPRFEAAFLAIRRAFEETPVRPAFHAGSSYPETEEEALRAVDGYFTDPRGPGALAEFLRDPPGAVPGALFAPHYDPRRGGYLLAQAFARAAQAGPLERVVVLGTNHQPCTELFTATRKAFATPFGVVPADEAALDALEARYPGDLYADEFGHRREHSIEFQALMLAYVWKKLERGTPPPLVPILVGSFHELYGCEPAADERVRALLDGLARVSGDRADRTLFVASGDLSHVGLRFGDEEPLDEAALAAVGEDDRDVMEAMVAGSAAGFHRSIARHEDRRRVCGHSCGYVMMKAFETASGGPYRGEVLGYDLTEDPDGAVSYCAVAFCR